MTRTLDEWISYYNRKTPEKFERDERFELFFSPEKGFCEVGERGGIMIINQLAGDGRYWKALVSKAARASGIRVCGTWCIRKGIRAYIRLFGYEIERVERTKDGRERFFCVDDEGRQAVVSPAFWYKDTKIQAYFVTWEV